MTCEHCSGTGTCFTSSCRRCNADRLCFVCQGFGEVGVAAWPGPPLHDGERFPEEPDRKIEKLSLFTQLTDFDNKTPVFFAFLVAILTGSFVSGVVAGWATAPVPKPNYIATTLRRGALALVVPQKLIILAES